MEQASESGSWSPRSETVMESQYPLHRACRDGDLEALSSLLNVNNPEFYQEDGFYGWTPIHWASYFGKFTCLMRLIENGCNCDYPTHRLNQTPLHMAALNGKGHCLKWLLHCGAAINRKDYLGDTPIHKSARSGSMECVSLLISQGTNLSIRNHNGQTPSQLAADSGHQECAAYIERAAQMELAPAIYKPRPMTNPSTDLRPSFTEQNGQVVTDGKISQEDDMDTDMSDDQRVPPQTGVKRSRESCEDDECKKSRRDEPINWKFKNGLLQESNDFNHHGNLENQNGFFQQQINGVSLHGNSKFQNSLQQIPNGFSCTENGMIQEASLHLSHNDNKIQNGFLLQSIGQTCQTNNNSICVSTSTEEHYNSVSHQQGYDSLLMESFGNHYDGS